MKSQISALETARDNALKEIENLKKADESLSKLLDDLKSQHEKDIQKVTADYTKAVADLKAIHDADKAALEAALDAAKKEFAQKLADLEKTHADDMAGLNAQIRIINSELDGLHSDVEGINEAIAKINETIPTLATKQELKDHAARAEATYATKAALEVANTAIGRLQGRMDAVEKNLSTILKSLIALSERVDADEIAIEAAQAAANEAQATAEAAQKAAEDAQASADRALGNITSLIEALGVYANAGALEVKFQTIQNEMNANKSAAEKAIEDLKNADEMIYEALGEQDEALRALIEEKLSALETKVQGKLNEINGLISDLEETKLDIEDFDEAFELELAKALGEGGAINKAIAASISALSTEINGKITEINNELIKVNGKLDLITGVLEKLADRIQSLVFVPEYNDGKASANSYVFVKGTNKKVLSEDVVVKGTFKVTPARLASEVVKYAKLDKVTVKAVSTKDAATRAAAADKNATKVVVTAGTEGRLEVEATFPASVINTDNNPAIALFVEVGENIADDPDEPLDIDSKSYVSSTYVPVAIVEKNLLNSFVLYNGTKEYANETITKQWSDWKGEHTFAAGYTPYLKLDGKYYTPAQAEKMLTLPAGSLVPVRGSSMKYFDKTGTELNTPATINTAIRAVANGWETNVEMSAASKEAAMAHVGYYFTNKVSLNFTFRPGLVVAAKEYDGKYTIIRRQYDIVIEPASVAWDYATAVKLSSAKTATALYDQKIDKAFDKKFSELDVEMPAVDVKELDLATILGGPVTPVHKLTVGGRTVAAGAVNLVVDPVAILKHKIASVEVSKYAFSNKGESVYEFCNRYANDATQTDVNVKFNLTLGAVPTAETIDLGEQTIAYVPKFTYHEFTEAATVKAAFDEVASYFANYATFKSDIAAQAPKRVYDVAKKTNVIPNTNVDTEWTCFAPMGQARDGYNYYLRLSHADVASYSDTYAFQTTYKTWYGVDYTFKATAKLEQPSVRIDYFQDWVDTAEDGSRFANLKGKVEGGKYVIDTDDLSKYFYVEGVADSKIDPAHITVEYNVLTVADVKKGIQNIPVPATSPATVNASGHISESEIAWKNASGDYTAQELDVEAVLKVNGIAVNTKEITLKIADPIVDFTSDVINVNRVPYVDKVVNLWSNMKVYGVNTPATNLVNNSATSFAGMWNYNADTVYDLDLTFDPATYTVTVGGVDKTTAYEGKIVYDPSTQTVTYKADSAEQVEPVYVSIKATLKHKYGYMGLENHSVRVDVVFNGPTNN